MTAAEATETTEQRQPGTPSPIPGRVLRALVVIAATATVLFLLIYFLTFASWRLAVAIEVVVVVGSVVVWKRATSVPWLGYVVIASILLTAIAASVFLWTTWVTQADHDARLSAMVAGFCEVQLPARDAVQDCSGSITNTGNGNSCRYLAGATVVGRDPNTVVEALEEQGFRLTDLDLWGDPTEDGHSYLVQGDEVRLFSQASWQDDEGDLRCM
jgi:hypothetical protein